MVGALHGRGSQQAAIVMVNERLNGRGWAGHTCKTEEGQAERGDKQLTTSETAQTNEQRPRVT